MAIKMQKISYAFLTIIFLLIAGFGFVMPMTTDGHHHESGCPFMPGEQSVCMMTPLDHISAWQSTFTTLVPGAFSLILLTLCLVVIASQFFRPPDTGRSPARLQKINIPPSLYQQLFSKGILNPKAP